MNEKLPQGFLDKYQKARAEIHRKIIGLDEQITMLFVALLAKGHVLMEGEMGQGKTVLAKAFLEVFNLDIGRAQMTSDTMPDDIRFGYNLLQEGGVEIKNLKIERGSLFSQLILIDEINRAPSKTQSVLLEPLEEGTISYGRETIVMKKPYMAIATANPIETSGVFDLPEAACDRFMFKDLYFYPDEETMKKIYVRDRREFPLQKVFTSAEEILEAQDAVVEFRLHYDEHHYIVEYITKLLSCIRKSGLIERNDDSRGGGYGPTPRAGEDLLDASAAYAALHSNGREASHITFDDVTHLIYQAVRFKFAIDPRKKAVARELGINSNNDLIKVAMENTSIPIGLQRLRGR